jgi:hypothetical protein
VSKRCALGGTGLTNTLRRTVPPRINGIPVTLGGTLEFTFADEVNPANQLGRTFDLFDWTDVNPTGAFTVSSPYAWDLSNLYTTGEITLKSVPESACLTLAAVALVFIMPRR